MLMPVRVGDGGRGVGLKGTDVLSLWSEALDRVPDGPDLQGWLYSRPGGRTRRLR
jgi:hypothetical protein